MAAPPSPAPTPNLLRELEGRSKELIDRLEQGVQAEIQAQRDRVHRLVLDTPLPVLQRRGLVLVGLAAAPCGTLHTDLLVRLTPPEGTLLSRHSFVPGQPVVLLASESGQPAGPVLDATVVSQHGLKWLTVAVGGAGAAAVLDPGARRRWRMDAGPCLAPLQRQLDALGALGRLEGLRPGEARVRAVLLGEPRVARAAAAAPPAWARDARWAPAVADALARCGALNPSQRAAVGAALGATFSLWQGPPGTGKTQTLLALIQVALAAGRAARCGPGPILAVAETNAGADNLLEGLRARGVAAVRVGQPARVRPDLRALTLDALSERTGEGARAVKLRERASALLMRGRDRAPLVGSSAGSSLTHTYNNTLEAQAALALAEAISAADPSVRSVAILTPYAGQAASLLRHADPTRLRIARPADAEGDGALAAPDCADARGARPRGPLVCISTIDGFQGREADVVLLSTTRTQRLGFLADRRRVNVAITRARRGLVVLGCSALLRTHPVWREWLREAGHVPEAQPQRAERGGRRPRISADPGCYGSGCGVEEIFL
ncbi:putative ATP-dependent helicase [Auxenochlorella protothecoides]|uniref:Putative ATP-dependent helicase n=1 Tax=Auxenochlorella protothecoides TaxID=3075 RepID=A0A087SI65_AUXPR|nr:putative ATP-dependent helicase [Auxenochlorella protothecoides]KFM25419.1 putative ATP-dependent helicase [Auxenochlorella protothecoides]